jgi:hypothetical protein
MAHRPRLAVLGALGFLAVLAASPAVASGQDYVQYEVQFMTPSPDALDDLNEAMAAHNQEYHSGGPYHANVWYVVNGPRTGQLVWVMGPLTFGQLDDRPSVGGHDDDWQGNVVPHLEPEGNVSYWRRNDGASYVVDEELHPILRIRGFKIARGHMGEFMEGRRMIKEVAEAKGWTRSAVVLTPRFRPETGPDVVLVTPYDSWGDLDGGAGGAAFRDDFIDVHGQGAWQSWIDSNRATIEDSWDEYHQLLPELSGGS